MPWPSCVYIFCSSSAFFLNSSAFCKFSGIPSPFLHMMLALTQPRKSSRSHAFTAYSNANGLLGGMFARSTPTSRRPDAWKQPSGLFKAQLFLKFSRALA
uniref:Uncharacterized protein n=1 Tax=Cacopsylla melanoneura TaxID=428564 RepID=A0A8D9A587_9HEMI